MRQAKRRRHPRRGFGEQPMARSPLRVMGKGVTSGGVPGEPTGTQKCSDRARLALVVEGKTCPGRVPARPGEGDKDLVVVDMSRRELDCEASYRGDGWWVVSPRGTLDVYLAPLLSQRLNEVSEERRSKIVVDMTAVDYLDSSILAVLVAANGRVRALRGTFRLVITEPRLLRIIEVAGLSKSLTVYPSVDAAFADPS